MDTVIKIITATINAVNNSNTIKQNAKYNNSINNIIMQNLNKMQNVEFQQNAVILLMQIAVISLITV